MMKSMVVLALVAVVLPAALSAPSGILGLGGWGHLGGIVSAPGAIVVGPSSVSHSSLVQTHPSPVVVAHAPAVIAAPAVHAAVVPAARDTLVVGPSGIIAERQGVVGSVAVAGLAGHGLGLGHGVHW